MPTYTRGSRNDSPVCTGIRTEDGLWSFGGYAEMALEDRSGQRKKVLIHAILRPTGSQKFGITVKNISLSGFSAESCTGQPVGTRIWLTIPGLGPLEGEIEHNSGGQIGCSFSNLLNPAVLDSLVARYRVEQNSESMAET